ncbi:hypothetical protein SEQU_11875 [Staphylococcus equorum UMC-CNS-924]|uniref:hypothetical protein n=1 Tax=Staphylococcus equorum TaxID=246432 RepID=UPI000395E4A0|nr:hypothetical protein [Staphylococcus equorum]ERH34161.1 hypothetical protein SEQU_11875 [Staphylococcus equorum UMC-CNS-924]PTE95422.1 hypothetical protein BUY87_12655 [Staphylococcus equorum]
MILLIILISIFILFYISLVLSFINDRKLKNLKFGSVFSSMIIPIIFPLFSSYVHSKGAYKFYKKKDYKNMRKLIMLSTIYSAAGTSYLNEYITRIILAEKVYGYSMDGIKLKHKVKLKQQNQIMFNIKNYNNYQAPVPSM